MNIEKIKKEIESGEAVVIDVREKSEWDEGHIGGARLLSLGSFNAESIKDLPKDLPIYVYCRSGSRAGMATDFLHDQGFLKAENIGGLMAWEVAGGVLVK